MTWATPNGRRHKCAHWYERETLVWRRAVCGKHRLMKGDTKAKTGEPCPNCARILRSRA